MFNITLSGLGNKELRKTKSLLKQSTNTSQQQPLLPTAYRETYHRTSPAAKEQ